jgi:anti-sigma B factor antagonist
MAVEFSAWEEPVDETTQVVAVRGEVDIFTAPDFKTLIGAAIEAGHETIIIDLAEATFIDSSSLGVLISAHRRLGLRDGRLIIACNVREVRKTFTITGLDSVLEIVDDREAALAARGESPPTNEEAA